jgi:sentrin-specific protease 6/sentrin-specific protease 7
MKILISVKCQTLKQIFDFFIVFLLDDQFKSKKKRRSARIINHTERDNLNTKTSSKSNTHPIEVLDEADEVASDEDNPLKVNIETLVNSKNRSKAPAIVIFDSLRIASKTRVAATLREFLQLEYDHKKVLPMGSLERKLFNIDTIHTIEAAVPQQKNYSDCGLYVLQYIESYFVHRSSKMNFPLSSTFSEWCEKNLKGSTKRKEILNVINEHVISKDM